MGVAEDLALGLPWEGHTGRVCVAERVGVKCVGSCGMSHLCSNETCSDCFAGKCTNVWVHHTRRCCTDVCIGQPVCGSGMIT